VVCLGPRDPGEIVGPRPLSGVVVRRLNFTVRRRLLMRHLLRQLFAWLCTLLPIAAWWSTVVAFRSGARPSVAYFAVMIVGSALFIGTSLAVKRRWRAWRWLAGSSGVLLLLYATSVVMLGWEDVGGAAVAIPLAVLTGLGGCIGLILALRAETSHDAV
jgi:hypothetical protein